MRGGCENEVKGNDLSKGYRVKIWQEWSLIIEYWWLVWYSKKKEVCMLDLDNEKEIELILKEINENISEILLQIKIQTEEIRELKYQLKNISEK